MRNITKIKKLTCAALFLAIAFILPTFISSAKPIGVALSPMHLPVFLCGFVCGWPWGLAVGFIAPLLRFLVFGMPMLPSAIGMAFELAVYGLVSGLLYKILPKKIGYTYISLIAAMFLGRCAAVIVKLVIAGINGSPFVFAAYWSGSVVASLPGVVLQLILVPVIILALKKAKLILND